MKIVSDCFNFVTSMLSYIKFKNYKYVYLTGAAPKFWFGGRRNIEQNFIHEFLSSPLLQWRSQNLGSGETLCIHQRLLKIFGKLIKQLVQKFKKFSKIFQK